MAALTAEQLFDSIGPAYETAWKGVAPQDASVQWLLSELESRKPAKCLDIGCGTGRPVCLALSAAGHDVTGIDVSGAMIEAAKANVPDARFEKVDVKNYVVEDGSLDAVTVYFSMIAGFSQEEIRGYILRIHGWLRPGGVFVFATVPIPNDSNEIVWLGRRTIVSSLEADEAVGCIRDAGFEVLSHDVTVFKPQVFEAGITGQDAPLEEPHLFVYAKK